LHVWFHKFNFFRFPLQNRCYYSFLRLRDRYYTRKARTLSTLILLNEVPERPFQQEQTITSTPDMLNPPAQFGRRLIYNISTRTLIALPCFGCVNFPDSVRPKQASINAFYVIAFSRCRSQRLQFNVSERGREFIQLYLSATPFEGRRRHIGDFGNKVWYYPPTGVGMYLN